MVFVPAEEQLSKEQEVTGSNQQEMEQWQCYFMPLRETHERTAFNPASHMIVSKGYINNRLLSQLSDYDL